MKILQDITAVLRTAILDLRGGYKNFYIVFFCLYIGVFLVATVQLFTLNVDEALRYNGRYILGGDIAIRTIGTPISKNKIENLKDLGVVSVVMETRATARKEDGSQSLLVELKAVDPFYPPYGTVSFVDEKGKTIMFKGDKGKVREARAQDIVLPKNMKAFKAGKSLWGVAVEKEILKRLNLKIGDILLIGKQKFRIRGIIDKEPDKLGSSKFTVFPRAMISYYTIKRTGLATEGGQIFYDHRIFMPYIKKIDELLDAIKKIETLYPNENWHGRSFLDAAPNMRENIDIFNLFLTLSGVIAILVGGIGIATSVKAYLRKKYNNIAIFKTIGISTKKIFWIYFMQMLIVAAPALILAVLSSVAFIYFILDFIATKLALEVNVKIDEKILFLSAMLGLCVYMIFMTIPVISACKVKAATLFRSMVEGINSKINFKAIILIFIFLEILSLLIFLLIKDINLLVFFFIAVFIFVGVFGLLALFFKTIAQNISFKFSPVFLLACKNIYRPANATFAIFISVGIILTILVSIFAIENNFKQSLKDDLQSSAPSFYLMDINSSKIDKLKLAIDNFAPNIKLKLIPILRANIGITKTYIEISYMQKNILNEQILKGKWWEDKYDKSKIYASIDQETANINNFKIGDEITIYINSKLLKLHILNIRKNNQNSFSPNFPIIISPPDGIKTDKYMAILNIEEKQELEFQNYLASKFPTILIVRTKDAYKSVLNLTSFASNSIKLAIAIITVIAVLVLQGSIAAGRQNRIYDTAILKLLGISRQNIAKIFLLEYGISTLFAGLFAAIFGVIFAHLVSIFLLQIKTDILFNIAQATVIILSAILTILLIGYINIWGLLSQKAAKLLREIS